MPPRERNRFLQVLGGIRRSFSGSPSRSTSPSGHTRNESTEVTSGGRDRADELQLPGRSDPGAVASKTAQAVQGGQPAKPPAVNAETRDWASLCLNAIKTTLTVVKEATNGVPVPALQGIAAGLVAIVNIQQDVAGNKKDIEATIALIGRLRAEILSPILSSSEGGVTYISQGLLARARQLEDDMEQVALRAEGKMRENMAERIANHEADKAIIQEMNSELRRLLDEFTAKGVLALEIQAENDRYDRSRILVQTMSQVNARYNSGSRRQASRCFEGTRTKVLQHITSWMDDPSKDRPIFWLSGVAGIGKSAIAHTIAEDAEKSGRLGASFFFSRDDISRREAGNLFPNIAQQLAFFNMGAMHALADIVRSDPGVVTAFVRTQVQKLLLPALNACKAERKEKFIIVIDALDECSPESGIGDILVSLTNEVSSLAPAVRILVTSRPEPHIERKFSLNLLQFHDALVLHNVDQKVTQQDIQNYLVNELTAITQEFSLADGWFSDSDLTALVDMAGGLFLVASTATKFIADSFINNPVRQLRTLIDDRAKAGVSHLSEIDKLYTQVLDNSLPPDPRQRQSVLPWLKAVLLAIALLEEPLPPSAMEAILAFPANIVRSTTARLHSIMIVPPAGDASTPIRSFHQSFPDFLLDSDRCPDQNYLVNRARDQAVLALGCLRILNRELKKDICDIQDNSKLNAEIADLPERLDRCVSSHLRYACSHFATHLAVSDDKGMYGELEKFCHTRLLMWIEVLSLLGKVGEALPSLKAIGEWLKAHDDPASLYSLMSDAIYMIRHFFVCLQKAALQAYLSPVFLMPAGPLTKLYSPNTDSPWIAAGCSPRASYLQSVPHGNSVSSLAVSGDGKRVGALACPVGSIDIWHCETGAKELTLAANVDQKSLTFTRLALSFDASCVLLAFIRGNQQALFAWSHPSWTTKRFANCDFSTCRQVAFTGTSHRVIFPGQAPATLLLLDVDSGSLEDFSDLRQRCATAFTVDTDGIVVATLTSDMDVQIWDVETRTILRTLTVSGCPAAPQAHPSLVFVNESRRLVYCALQRIANYHTATFSGPAEKTANDTHGPKQESQLQMYDVDNGSALGSLQLPGGISWVSTVQPVSNGVVIVSGLRTRMYNFAAGSWFNIGGIFEFSDEDSEVPRSPNRVIAATSSSGSVVATTTFFHGRIFIYGGSSVHSPPRQETAICALSFSADGTRLAARNLSDNLISWTVAAGSITQTLSCDMSTKGNGDRLRHSRIFSMADSGTHLVEGVPDAVWVRSLSDGSFEHKFDLSAYIDVLYRAILSPDATRIVAFCYKNRSGENDYGNDIPLIVSGTHTASGPLIRTLEMPPQTSVKEMIYSSDGHYFLCHGVEYRKSDTPIFFIKLYDAGDTSICGNFEDNTYQESGLLICGVAFSVDCQCVFAHHFKSSSPTSSLVRVFDVRGMTPLRDFDSVHIRSSSDYLTSQIKPSVVTVLAGWLGVGSGSSPRHLCWLPEAWQDLHSILGGKYYIRLGGPYIVFGFNTEELVLLDIHAVERAVLGHSTAGGDPVFLQIED